MDKENSIITYINKDNTLDLQRIVNDYTNYVFMIIKNMTKELLTNEDMEEIISDVFLAIWKNKGKIDSNLPLKPYIAGVSKNIIKNRLRSFKKNDSLEFENEVKSQFDLDEVIESQEVNEIILDELKKSDEEKQIFIMFYHYGKKAKEIAEEMGYTEINVSTKLHRLRKRLKKVLNERGYTYGK